ncbi:hypothetical protein TRFO_07561 [Tritrichomonas foetus]|uniref:HYDIN/VesB/CFA65-like Ig-like domain-containing protein n=1 Tax=Tritrichomonas foetus TaxID=1144522 RepID=A0A1J4JQ97_9EUKA|nr:hypothetical protein TRFO_07561 [Tritrichomonas foetus]|eukprot:OHT01335.1 hypothetical protein TRFO_07561 [Tritrichomonas foetus]
MTNEVTVSSFIIGLDVVHSSFESQAFLDYLKNNCKKYIILINAPDFVESAGRTSRNSTDSRHSHSLSGSSRAIVKGINNKIKTELHKLVEIKRKMIIQAEKKAQQLLKQLAKSGTASSRSKSPIPNEPPPAYEGQTEVVFIIVGFPYTPSQLKSLSSHVDIGAFISIVNQSQITENTPLNSSLQNKKAADKTIKQPSSKKQLIHGYELDSSLNPGVVPPPRWNSIKPHANPDITFSQIDAPMTMEECWNALQYEIARIIRCRKEFNSHFKDHKFIALPSVHPKPDLSHYQKYLKQHSNDIINGILLQLKENEWKTSKPPPPPTELDIYKNLFNTIIAQTMRMKVVPDKDPDIEPFIEEPKHTTAFDILYQLLKWKLNDENAAVNKAVLDFYADYNHFNAVAGHRYESMLSAANKRLILSLPLSFFEWTNFKYAHEYNDVTQTLIEAAKLNYVFDTYLEEPAGIMWLLAMPPVSRTIGQPIRRFYMPPTLDGVSEWLTSIYENRPPTQEGRGRNALTPAQVIKSGSDISILLPSILSRTANIGNPIYKISFQLGNTVEYISPYFFINGVKVEIMRNIINNKMIFGFQAHFPNKVEITSNYDAVNIQISDDCRLIYNNNITILTEIASILYDKMTLFLKTDQTYIITSNGSLIFEYKGIKKILEPSGRIVKHIKDEWTYTDADGNSYKYNEERERVPVPHNHRNITDMGTKITRVVREDGLLLTQYQDGDRVITFADHFIIRQTTDSIVYEIPDLPFITYRDNCFTFMIDEMSIELNSSKISIIKESTVLDYDYNELTVNTYDSEVSILPGIFQMKVDDIILYADETGAQRIGPIVPPDLPQKRKIEVVESKWGKILYTKDSYIETKHLELLSIFRPRFFAIRSDLSATEFIHKTGFLNKDKVQKERMVDDYHLLTLHNRNENPFICFEQKTLDKQPRSNLLKTLQIPKQSRSRQRPRKGQPPEDPEIIINEARLSNERHLEFWRNLCQIQESVCHELEAEYREDIRPKTPPPPEIIEPPVFTPQPRLLEMMHMKHTEKEVKEVSYWNSPEAEFAYPLDMPKVLPRPLEPRTKLFDMPPGKQNFDEPPKIPDPDPPCKDFKQAQPSPRRWSGRVYPTEVSRPQTAHSVPQRKIEFGTVPVGKTVSATLDIQNTGTKPLHYSVSQPGHKDVVMNTLPGKIMPGLKLIIKLTLTARTIGPIQTSFMFMSPLGDISVPVTANVIDSKSELYDDDGDSM